MEQEIVQCHDIEAAEEICFDFQHKTATYSEPEFRVNMFIADTSFPLARHVVGPQNTRTLTVLGWTDDTRILNATLYPDHVQKNTPQFMTALFKIGRIWLGAATILPPRHIQSRCLSHSSYTSREYQQIMEEATEVSEAVSGS